MDNKPIEIPDQIQMESTGTKELFRVTCDRLIVRFQPKRESYAVKMAFKGMTIKSLGDNDESSSWLHVVMEDGTSGYVMREFLEQVGD